MEAYACIKAYINSTYYAGGLIGISELSDFCNVREGQLYAGLSHLNKSEIINIIKRYSCPEFHEVDSSEVCENSFFCHECDLNYSKSDLILEIYIDPLTLRSETVC